MFSRRIFFFAEECIWKAPSRAKFSRNQIYRGKHTRKSYGTRYLDPKYSRWISTDLALGDYIPAAGKANAKDMANLPGMGGIFNHTNAGLFHYAGNNPVRYIDPDGNSSCSSFKLNKNQQDLFLSKISKVEKAFGWISTFASIGSFAGNIPNPVAVISGNSLSIISTAVSMDASEMGNVVDLYNQTGFEAAKEYARNTSGDFDADCTMTLVFASVDKEVSCMNDPTAVLKKFQDNPGKKLTPADMTETQTSYYMTIQWKDKNGKTIGGTQIQLYKSTYEQLINYAKDVSNE